MGAQGQPAGPVPLVAFANPTGCSLVAGSEIAVIGRCPAQFNVTIRTVSQPGGAIRGQLGSTCSI